MQENTHSHFPEESDHVNLNSGQQQEEIQFLNESTGPDCIADDLNLYSNSPAENAGFLERYKAIEGIEILATDEEIKRLLMQFEPDSLHMLQETGNSLTECIYNDTLHSLSSLLPVKVQFQPDGLSQPLILLIFPQLMEEGYIHLTFMPYAKSIPPIPLTGKQQEALNQNACFFIVKRVIDGILSPVFEHKRDELWDTLTLSVAIGKKPFKELLEIIKHQPLEVEKWIQNQFWTTQQSEKAIKIIELIFPLQFGLFTGLHLLFYPFGCLHRFPHLQAAIQARLLEQQ